MHARRSLSRWLVLNTPRNAVGLLSMLDKWLILMVLVRVQGVVMRSSRPEFPFRRLHVSKHAMVKIRRYVVAPTHYRYTPSVLRISVPSYPFIDIPLQQNN